MRCIFDKTKKFLREKNFGVSLELLYITWGKFYTEEITHSYIFLIVFYFVTFLQKSKNKTILEVANHLHGICLPSRLLSTCNNSFCLKTAYNLHKVILFEYLYCALYIQQAHVTFW